MNIDLHLHTTFSDGDLSPREVVETARQKGLSLIAVTDHDECRGFGETGETQGIAVLPGIELATKFEGEAHVLGLRIDWRSGELLRHIDKVAKLRKKRAEDIIKRLSSAGVEISINDVKRLCQGGVIGRPHIAAALVDKGYCANVKEAFKTYLSKHTEFYVAFDKISVDEAAGLIIRAGGRAVLAHPGLLGEAARNRLLPQLKKMGFWGIEAYHPSHSDGQCAEFESLARSQGIYVTAGSDFHGSAKPSVLVGSEVRGGEYLRKSVAALVAD